jgi:mono/diheme cytochrome c family protein
MFRANPAVGLIIGAVALAAGAPLASAQQPGGGTPPPADPTKITVTRRVYDTKSLVNPPALSESAYRGRALWLQRCAYCHDGVGQPSYNTLGSWLGAETVQTLGEVAVRAIIGAGTAQMPGFRYTMKPQQMDDLIAFLKTVSSDKKPTPAQLAGRTGAAGSGD